MNEKARLVLASMLMLFVELMLIRWTGSNIYHFLFLTNFILLASFLGIGIGFLRARQCQNAFHWAPVLLSVLVLLIYLCSREYQPAVNLQTGNLDYNVSNFDSHLLLSTFSVPVIFMMVTAAMAAIAGMVAESFRQFASLQAYRLEVLGTLLGISMFTVLAFLAAPPIVWGVVITGLFVALLLRSWSNRISFMMLVQIGALGLMLGVFYQETKIENQFWSTYYKIHVIPFAPQSYVVNVNGLAQQVIEPAARRIQIKPFYIKPYEHMGRHKQLERVLVIGAGTGGDVAIALAQGAKHVDAVEIDPRLYALGKKFNVDQPYADPRVTVHINDGRAFLRQSLQQYDLIIYALTDSLMLVPGQSSVRLENYLYTYEGLSAAASHLKSGGVFTFYSYLGQEWLTNRIANTLDLIFHQSPCVDVYGVKDYWATVLTVSRDASILQCPRRWSSSQDVSQRPATDDHPFIHLQHDSLPPLSICMLVFVAIFAGYAVRRTSTSLLAIGANVDLFLMGAAFLLLEAKCVVTYALLFGTTWMVNSAVFAGVITSVYLAIEITARVRSLNVFLLYGCLLVSLLLIWMVPASALLSLPGVARFAAATALNFAPILLANLIFARRLESSALSTDAMGANLMGAVLGGMLEYLSLMIGYQNLIFVVAVIYSLAYIWLRYVSGNASDLGTDFTRAALRH